MSTILVLYLLSAPSPVVLDLCPSPPMGAVFGGSYGNVVISFTSLDLQYPLGSFRAHFNLHGRLNVQTDSAGNFKAGNMPMSLSVVYVGAKPVNVDAAESYQGACTQERTGTPTTFTLSCTFTPGKGAVRVDRAGHKATLTFTIGHVGCGTVMGVTSFSFVQSKIDALARLGIQVTRVKRGDSFTLIQKSGGFFDAQKAQEASLDQIESLLDASYKTGITDVLLGRISAIARTIEADLRGQPDLRFRTCLKVHLRNRVNLLVQARAGAAVTALFKESDESKAFIHTGAAVSELVRWLNLLTAAGIETCSAATQNDLMMSIRRKLKMVVEYSLLPGVPAQDVTQVLARVPLTGAVSGALARQVTQQIRDFGKERILDELAKLKNLKTPANLCDPKVAAAWSKAEAIELLINQLTGATFREVANHRKLVSPRKCKTITTTIRKEHLALPMKKCGAATNQLTVATPS